MNKRVKCEEPCDGRLSSMVPREGRVKFPPLTRQQNWNLGTVCSDTSGTDCSDSMVQITPLCVVPIQRYRHHISAKEGGTQSQPLEKFLRLILYYDCSKGWSHERKYINQKVIIKNGKKKAQGRSSVDKTISPELVFTSVRDKKCCHVLRIFVSQTFHQNPIGINTIAIVSPWENIWER